MQRKSEQTEMWKVEEARRRSQKGERTQSMPETLAISIDHRKVEELKGGLKVCQRRWLYQSIVEKWKNSNVDSKYARDVGCISRS